MQSQFNKFAQSLKNNSDKLSENNPFDRIFLKELKVIGFDFKRAEELVKQFGDIIEQSNNEIYIFDLTDLNFVHANRGALQNCGFSLSQLKSKRLPELMPELSIKKFESLVYPLKQRKAEKIRFESINLRKDNTTYPIEIHLTNSLFNQKPVYVAFIYNITIRKREPICLFLVRLFPITPPGRLLPGKTLLNSLSGM